MVTIYSKSYLAEESKSNIFRLQPDAAQIIRKHAVDNHMSASYILSEIVRQAEGEGIVFE